MKKFTFLPLTITRFLGVVFLWMNLGHAPDLHAQTRKPALNFTLGPANTRPYGLWSNGTTMWVTDASSDKLYAYNLAIKARNSTQDFILATENDEARGIWSNGTTMWVTDASSEKLYAYNLATKARDEGKDFETLQTAGNTNARGIWSNGTTMWVADAFNEKLYAYNLATKARDADKDFPLDVANNDPEGIWSDGITMWVVGVAGDDKIYAYNLATKVRDENKDFNTLNDARNDDPRGLWSDDRTMWVVDFVDDKLYAYAMPKKDQTITFTFSEGVLDDTLDLSDIATASSMLEVSYVSSDPSIAEVGTGMEEGKLILKSLGTATITASQGGDDRYAVATDVSHTITVSEKLQQTITFTFSEGVLDDRLDLSDIATASSMLEVSYVSSASDIAEVGTGMEEGKLILKSLGTATITASQAGNDRYLVATDVSHTITVSEKLQQMITFTLPSTGMLDDRLDLSDIATASSMLEVSYVSSASDIAEVGTGMEEGKLILRDTGTVIITASQAGNARYLAATDVSHTITVSKKDQTITFTLSPGILDDTLDLSATASSGLEVSYVSSASDIAEVGTGMEEGKLILKSLGTSTITASQGGNDRYLVATDVSHTITVSEKLQQTITFIFSEGVLDDTLDLSDIATASSMLEVSYVSSASDIAEVGTGMEEGKLILKSLGTATITASQGGDDRYLEATNVTQDITVSKKSQTITFALSAADTLVGDISALSATSSSGLEVSYVSSDPSIAEVGTGMNAGKLFLKALGNATITASQIGNEQYDVAMDVSRTIRVAMMSELELVPVPIQIWPVGLESTLRLEVFGTLSTHPRVTWGGLIFPFSSKAYPHNNTGIFSHTPEMQGISILTFTFGIRATEDIPEPPDALVNEEADRFKEVLFIFVNPVKITPAPVDLGVNVNTPMSSVVLPTATGGNNIAPAADHVDLVYTLTGLPDGLSFDPVTWTLSGTPTLEGVFELTYKVFDPAMNGGSDGNTDTKTFNIVVHSTTDVIELPSAVTDLTAIASHEEIILSWSEPMLNGSTIIGYDITYGETTFEVASQQTSTTISGLTNGQEYSFMIVAKSAIGNSSSSAPATGTPVVGSPLQITGLSATAGNEEVTLTWLAPANDGGSPITDYKLSRDGNSPVSLSTILLTDTVTGLMNDQEYTFTISATNTHGDSESSAPVTATPVDKNSQMITFTLLSSMGLVGDTLALSATSSSGLEVSYVSSKPSVAEVNADKLILKAGGSAIITANQAGDAQYFASTSVTQDISVSKKTQTITFTLSGTGVVGDTLDLSATASSGLEVSYSISNTTIAEVGTGMNAGKLILKAGGTATITASQVENPQYLAAPAVSHTITVDKNSQMITFTLLSSTGLVGDTLDLSATASSGLEVSYVSSKPSVAEVNADKLILKAGGSAIITANQAGDAQYFASTSVTQDISVNKKTQTITFTLSSAGVVGDTLDLSATASSGLEVTYSSSAPGIAEVGTGMNAGKLILKALGNATITASQAGNARYLAAPDVTHTITVNKKDQTITFTLSGTGVVGDTLDLSATASSGLEVTYSSSAPGIAEVGTGMNADKLILKALGNATITASQAGNARYLAAPDVTRDIMVSEKALGVDVKNTDIRVWPNPVATQLNISSGSKGKLSITLRNLMGQRLQERELEGKGQMDLTLVPAGVYLLHIRTAKETISYLIYKE